MSEIKGYAFDIEGTLYKGGHLRDGVDKLFQEISKTGKPIMFVSGMNEAEITRVVAQIENEANIDLSKATISYNAGAVIRGQDGKYIAKNYLSDIDIAHIENIVENHSDSAIIVRRSKDNNYRFAITEAEGLAPKAKKLATQVIVKLLEIMKVVELDSQIATRNQMCALKDVGSLEIVALPNIVKELAKKLASELPHLTINAGASLQISTKNKMYAIQKVFGEDLKDIMYFGDGINDLECLRNCGYAVAANSKKVQVLDEIKNKKQTAPSQTFATKNLGDEEFLKFVAGQKFEQSKLDQETFALIFEAHKKDDKKSSKEKVAEK